MGPVKYHPRKVRKKLKLPETGAINFHTGDRFCFVKIMNVSSAGALVESDMDLGKKMELNLVFRDAELERWRSYSCVVVWCKQLNETMKYRAGLNFISPEESPLHPERPDKNRITSHDLDFILRTRLLQVLPQEGVCSFLNCLSRKIIPSGYRFITQGEKGESLFLVQKGLCSVQIALPDGTLKVEAQRREGDVIGEMALLTGEVRMANVMSESDMILWELTRKDFDRACRRHPDIREFLTELLTNRLENSRITGVRNVGRYLIHHRIGDGGWSLVYKGTHKKLGMPVAIKMLKHNQAMDEDFLENFRTEGKVIARLNHANIVQIYDIEELYRTAFIIMEYLEGESLEALLQRKGGLPFSRAMTFLIQVCRGLAYAHDRQIVHRDVKPANIFILKDDQIKLLDFGLACPPGEEDYDQTGTVHYMSPEQVEGEPVDHRSDIYSLGILAYEIFTGQRPFAGDDIMGIMKMHLNSKLPDPCLLVPDLPEQVRRFIFKASAKSPDQRYDSMDEILEILGSISKTLKEEVVLGPSVDNEVTVLLVFHGKDRNLALNRLLDQFSRQAEEKGFLLNIAGTIGLDCRK